MSDETTLLSCPFCGGEASVKVMEYDDDYKVWGVFCESDLESEYNHGHFLDNFATEADAIAAWNTRSDYAVQAANERKAEQAIAATLGGGTLTAEQVRKVLLDHLSLKCRDREYQTDAWQAIADELNARAERTCVKFPSLTEQTCIVRRKGFEAEFGYWRCSECNCENFEGARYCMGCGAKVVGE